MRNLRKAKWVRTWMHFRLLVESFWTWSLCRSSTYGVGGLASGRKYRPSAWTHKVYSLLDSSCSNRCDRCEAGNWRTGDHPRPSGACTCNENPPTKLSFNTFQRKNKTSEPASNSSRAVSLGAGQKSAGLRDRTRTSANRSGWVQSSSPAWPVISRLCSSKNSHNDKSPQSQ